MTRLPMIDTHVHLWNSNSFHLPWLTEIPFLNHPYELQLYQEQTQQYPIEGIVCVEAGVLPDEALREARWLVEQASYDARIQGIVAAASIEESSHIHSYLRELIAIDARIKGVRRNIQGETMPNFCLQPAFVEGVQCLPEYGLSFDLCLTHAQLPEVIALVRQCPETYFILDHLGKPDIRHQTFDPWRQHIQELAAFPNVACKISGLVTEAHHQQWTVEDIAPAITHVVSTFGEDRVMFGSDWPVLLLAASYQRWLLTLDEVITNLTLLAKQKLWSGNARRIYRLEPSST